MLARKAWVWIALLVILPITGCGSLFSSRNSIVEVSPKKGQNTLAFHTDGKGEVSPTLASSDLPKPSDATVPHKELSKQDDKKESKVILPPALQLITAKPPETPLQSPPPVPEPPKEFPKTVETKSYENEPKKLEEKSLKAESLAVTPQKSEPLSPLALALQNLLDNNSEKAKSLLKDPSVRNQAIVSELLPLVASLGSSESFSSQEATQWIQATTKVQSLLRNKAELSLENLQYCKNIHGFGSLDPLPANYGFKQARGINPGEKVQIYVEVHHVNWQKEGSDYEATFSSNLEIHDSQGKVTSMAFPPKVERAKTPRNDYYLFFQFRVPPKLPPGLYTLWIQVDEPSGDQTPGRTCKRSMDLRIVP